MDRIHHFPISRFTFHVITPSKDRGNLIFDQGSHPGEDGTSTHRLTRSGLPHWLTWQKKIVFRSLPFRIPRRSWLMHLTCLTIPHFYIVIIVAGESPVLLNYACHFFSRVFDLDWRTGLKLQQFPCFRNFMGFYGRKCVKVCGVVMKEPSNISLCPFQS